MTVRSCVETVNTPLPASTVVPLPRMSPPVQSSPPNVSVPEPVTVASWPLVLLSLNMSMLAEPLTVMVVPFAPAVWAKAVNEAPSRRVALPEERMTLR